MSPRRLSLYDSSGTSSVVREVLGPSGHLAGIGDSISLRDPAARRSPLREFVRPGGRLRGRAAPALKAFLQGEAAFAHDSWALAQRYYETALDLDPAFALAEWRLANVKHWRRLSREPDLADIYRRHAARFRQSDRRLIEALLEPISSSASSGSRTRSGVGPETATRACSRERSCSTAARSPAGG